jgi:hypothetical protein
MRVFVNPRFVFRTVRNTSTNVTTMQASPVLVSPSNGFSVAPTAFWDDLN